MNSTTDVVVESIQNDPVAVIILASALFISEVMPVLPIKPNGVLHSLLTLFQRAFLTKEERINK